MPPKPSPKPKPAGKSAPKGKKGLPGWALIAIIGAGLLIGFVILRRQQKAAEQPADQAVPVSDSGYVPMVGGASAPAPDQTPAPTFDDSQLIAQLQAIEASLAGLGTSFGGHAGDGGSVAGSGVNYLGPPIPAPYTPPQPPSGAPWTAGVWSSTTSLPWTPGGGAPTSGGTFPGSKPPHYLGPPVHPPGGN